MEEIYKQSESITDKRDVVSLVLLLEKQVNMLLLGGNFSELLSGILLTTFRISLALGISTKELRCGVTEGIRIERELKYSPSNEVPCGKSYKDIGDYFKTEVLL